MGKFIGFEYYLQAQTAPQISFSFCEIEKHIGESLCASAYKWPAYWRPSPTHTFANAIVDSGYKVDHVDLKNQILYLSKNLA